MISFKTYLTEARMAPLYHSTSSWSAVKILESNILKGSIDRFGKSVSLTRSLSFAKKWRTTGGDFLDDIIIFELNQQKLAQNYRIEPFNYFTDKARRHNVSGGENEYNEYEERIRDKDVTNFDKYITKIIVLVKPGKKIAGNTILNHPKLWYSGKFVNK